jgi:NADPH:quinone reductase-like Zn-dependent oxidoreductase
MDEQLENRALWLSSFSSPPEVVCLPVPTVTQGSAVIRVEASFLTPYTDAVHSGKIAALNLKPPFVPNPGAIGRVHAVGSDSVKLKHGDLVFVDSTVRARDDPKVIIMQGHHGGDDTEMHRKLMHEWRDGSLQQFQKVPLENCFLLNEQRLLGELKYNPADLTLLVVYMVAAGAIIEAANIKAGETIAIGPSGGSFGGAAVELTLALGANVIALGRNKHKLEAMKLALGSPDRLQYAVMTGDFESDAAAIKALAPETGIDVYNDWTPSEFATPLYLSAASHALKGNGKVVMSGGAHGDIVFPHLAMLHKNLNMMGKWMYHPATAQLVINMVTAGTLKIGKKNRAEVAAFSLDAHHAAVENAAKNGGWGNFTVVTPHAK